MQMDLCATLSGNLQNNLNEIQLSFGERSWQRRRWVYIYMWWECYVKSFPPLKHIFLCILILLFEILWLIFTWKVYLLLLDVHFIFFFLHISTLWSIKGRWSFLTLLAKQRKSKLNTKLFWCWLQVPQLRLSLDDCPKGLQNNNKMLWPPSFAAKPKPLLSQLLNLLACTFNCMKWKHKQLD